VSDEATSPRHKTKALRTCAEWLAYCLKLGWPKSDLNELEALWWQYHDENGNLFPPSCKG
jgi:hypothetical protein